MKRLLIALLIALPSWAQALPAFPGAMGAGAASIGGRGGIVMEVTNLNDSGAGSLRACVQASGPRNCVFRVSGLITQKSPIIIRNPYITIWGQSVPGGGIVQGGVGQIGQALAIETHDVVIRYLTYDGAASAASGSTCNHDTGTVGYEVLDNDNYNIIIDHTSHRWWGNKDMEIVSNGPNQNAHDLTVSWNLFYEPCFQHPVVTEPDVFGGGSQFASVNQDWHHNFAINYDHRWPLGAARSMRWVNNRGYNGIQNSTSFNTSFWGAIQFDGIGNDYVDGPNSTQPVYNIAIQPDPTSSVDPADCNPFCDNGPAQGRAPTVYLLNNSGHGKKNVNCCLIPITNVANDAGNLSLAAQVTNAEGAFNPVPVPASWVRSTPLPPETYPIVADPVTNLDNVMLPTVGNSQRIDCSGNWVSNRDSQDARVIQQYQVRGKGGPWEGPTYTGPHFPGAPAIPGGTPCTESLHDGIADQWKQAHNLSTTDPNLYKTPSPNGYTYLELYLNGTSVTPPPTNPPCWNTTNCPIGSSVSVITGPANIRNQAASTNPPIGTQPTGAVGVVQSNPTNPGATFAWVLVQFNGAANCSLPTPTFSANCGYIGNDNLTPSSTPPPPHPTVTCTPTSIPTGSTSTCTANQAITSWSASAGSITAAGIFTAPSTAQTVTITGTNANGSGSVPITVTAAPPPTVYPTITLQIAIPGGSTTTLTCTSTNGAAYVCK